MIILQIIRKIRLFPTFTVAFFVGNPDLPLLAVGLPRVVGESKVNPSA